MQALAIRLPARTWHLSSLGVVGGSISTVRAVCLCRSRKVMQLLGGGSRPKLVGILQRYYPQCVACSGKQSAAVKAAKPTLVLHYYGMRPWYYAGVPL